MYSLFGAPCRHTVTLPVRLVSENKSLISIYFHINKMSLTAFSDTRLTISCRQISQLISVILYSVLQQ